MNSSKPDVIMIGPFPDDVSLIKGGVQASVYGLAKALQVSGKAGSVTGISTPIKANAGRAVRTQMLDGLEVQELNAPLGFLVSSALHIPAILRQVKQKPNPVAHMHGTGLLEALLCIVLRLKRIPCVWTLHGITEKETLQRLKDRFSIGNLLRYVLYTGLERLMLFICPAVIVDTQYVKDHIARKDAIVIPQGIFIDEFEGMATADRDEKLIACVGVIDPRKGHVQTIEAFGKLHERLPEARLVIAGSLTVPGYLEEMKQKIDGLGLSKSITLEVQQPRSTVLGWLRRAQVFTLHSREESQGIALCEALACGLPVVATHVGGIPYVVENGKSGVLVDYGDTDKAALALEQLLTNPVYRKNMGLHALNRGREFGWPSIASRVLEVYRSLFKR